ncbi:MAG: ABC transporter substrate-binding protein [Candidatus Carbobacillus sp.]|nr:ABC transporter substrate-binding protein [Candidatus Carbobacillus sp.]
MGVFKKSGWVHHGWRYAVVLMAFVLVVTISGCGSGQEAFKKVRLQEVTHSVFYAPQYVALSKGYFKDEGLDVELVDGKGGDKVTTALLSGEADIILVGAEMAVFVNAQDPVDPIRVFARLTQRDGSFLVSREPMPDFKWEDLRGKAYLAQRKGGMPDTIGQYVLRKHGLEPGKDIEYLQHIDYANLAPAFVSGTGDVVQLFEPFASQIELEGKGYVVASLGAESGKVLYTSYLTRQSTIQNNRDMLVRFTRAIAKGQAFVQTASSEEIYEAIKDQFPGLEKNVMLTIIDRLKKQDVWGHDPTAPEEDYLTSLELIEQAGHLEKKLPYEQVVDPTIAEDALKQLK